MDITALLKERIAGLADDVYSRRDQAAVAGLPPMAAMSGFQGTLLGVPRRVDLAREPGLTALVLSGRTRTRSHQLPWQRNAVLVASDVDRGTVYAGPAFHTGAGKSPGPAAAPLPPEPPPPVPAGAPGVPPPPEGSNVGTAWLDVQDLLSPPLHNARLALRVLYFDQVSNAPIVQRIADATPLAPRTQADAQALVERLRQAGQSRHKLPMFRRHAASPALTGSGVAFTLGPIGESIPLHAALRIELAAPMLVQARPGGAPAGQSPPPPQAVLKATILVVRRNHPTPHVLPLEFPVWFDGPVVAGQLVEAAFSVDLATLLHPQALEAGSQVYVLAGRHLGGPVPLSR